VRIPGCHLANGLYDTTSVPFKIREVHSHHFDSAIWDDFHFRDEDKVISTDAKSGTT